MSKLAIIIFIFTFYFELSTFNSVAQTTVCQGDTVVLIVDNPAGAIQWQQSVDKVVWQNIAGETDDTLKTAVADMYYRALIHDTMCSHQYNYYSDTLNFSALGNLPVSISITANISTPICEGTNIIFSAYPVNGGTNPGYQWMKNGIDIIGETTSIYSSSTLINNDIITCRLISNYPCPTGNPAVSNSLVLIVIPNSPVIVSIYANPGTSINQGTSVTFSATATNGGASPSYQWKLNGNNVGTNSNTYTNSSLANGNTVTCVLTSNAVCPSGNPATSNTLTMIVACSGTVTDLDGNIYNVVQIGNQCWMAQNLKTTKYRDGTSVPIIIDEIAWSGLNSGAYCNYNNDANNAAIYGRLYNWFAISDSRNIAPAGWHVATDGEWTQLTDYLGGLSVAGGKLKESDTAHWLSPNTGATNESGFTALPGGYRYYDGIYYVVGSNGIWWSATEYNASNAWSRYIYYYDILVNRGSSNKRFGCAVRCVRD